MKILVESTAPQDVRSQVLFVGMFEGEKPSENGLGRLDASLAGRIERAITTEDFVAKNGQLLQLYGGHPQGPRHILVAGLGKRDECNGETVRRAFGSAGKKARQAQWNDISVMPPVTGVDSERLHAYVVAALEGVALAMYRYVRRSRKLDKYPILDTLHLIADEDGSLAAVEDAARYAEATIEGVTYARDLVSTPAGDLLPEQYGKIARELENEEVKVEVFDHNKLKELKMGALLAVGQGSDNPPVMIHLSYEPDELPDDAKTFVIVGKGVTFDSGGLNIKSSGGIRDMKVDMAGSATVMGVFKVISRINPRCRVHGFIPAVENMTGGSAYHPGDVLTAYNGLTIEIDNTDAEGRLALADALSYAVDKVKPDAMVDLATLTGACVIALGHWATGLMSNNDDLVNLLNAAADTTGERLWRLPLWSDYGEQIKSEIADLKNTGGRPAGTITAGKFLEEFVGDTPWAHLDIAGTATDGPYSYTPHKELGTGSGVRLLLEALQRWA